MSIIQTLINAYLDYYNNYLTMDKYAEHNGLTVEQANAILKVGCELFETGGYKQDR